jgi:hypothetical protein
MTLAYLEDVAPILALVIKTFVQHLHDLHKIIPSMDRLASTLYRGPNLRTDCKSFAQFRSFESQKVPMHR